MPANQATAPDASAHKPFEISVTWIARFAALAGWRRYAVACGLGALAVLALPPFNIVPVLWIAFPGLIWLIDGSAKGSGNGRRSAFLAGWWFGVGHFSFGLYWISYALLVDPVHYGWMIPFALLGLGGGLGLFTGVTALGAYLATTSGVARILVFAGLWTLCEWLRGWIFTGFPWNLIGTVWAPVLPVAQLASVVGLYGLGFATVLIAAMPAALAFPGWMQRAGFGGSVAVLIAIAGWGFIRLPAAAQPTQPGVHLRLVQADVPESLKWVPELAEKQFQDHLRLSRLPGVAGMTAIIWPETATPYALNLDGRARALVGSTVPPGGLVITGTLRATPRDEIPFQIWNSVAAVNDTGRIIADYDKSHLVPFGEYVPFRGFLPIAKLTAGSVDFSEGPGPQTLNLPGLPPVGMLVCYEAIFPHQVVVEDPENRPAWMLNVTNDGWFGISTGPYQHFAAARFRSIEEGLPLVRDANTGISGVIDPYGRVTSELALGARGILDVALPTPLPPTPYSRIGNKAALLLAAASLAAGLKLRRGDAD